MPETKKILLVDDDKSFVESNTDLLEAYGYEIFTAYDGATGFKTAMKEHPDLVVLDVMMAHETEGFEVAQKIRKEPELKGTKILLVSGITKQMNLNYKLEPNKSWLPVDRIMEKPIDPARFIAEVEKLLG
ncbi:MAG: response regulator [Deltaproteobacteria bacterium]|nr:response regulator [Deltaproteobacteria bacterium]